LLKIAAMKFEL